MTLIFYGHSYKFMFLQFQLAFSMVQMLGKQVIFLIMVEILVFTVTLPLILRFLFSSFLIDSIPYLILVSST